MAVLRFDFTGLGESGDNFGNSDFGSNLDDVVSAANSLRAVLAAPTILIGHSLGSAAVLVATSPDTRDASCGDVVMLIGGGCGRVRAHTHRRSTVRQSERIVRWLGSQFSRGNRRRTVSWRTGRSGRATACVLRRSRTCCCRGPRPGSDP
ncbi:alpha/beta hydrolase family protein [Amycolatopsis palatopharyngis]|uniref:alpha/beta hydrolase family protein n=1 Tax=Amycolatopsis palatopharyngis TaxID=187982 RepID=UPI003CCC83A4